MDYLSKNISLNLKRIRLSRKLSLDDAAAITGVSKSMLGQIERGDSNPTISTIAKIIGGMRITVDDLIQAPVSEACQICRDDLTPIKNEEGQYAVYKYFPFEKTGEFEVYGAIIQADGMYQSDSHGEHSCEYVIVTKGTLTLKIDGEFYEIPEGDAMCFECDKEHKYINNSKETLSFVSYLTFSKKY